LTTSTVIAGYFFSKSATSLSMFGTQVQNVRVVWVVIALSMSAWPTGAAPAGSGAGESPQPASARIETVAAASIRRRLI
jgi:hypothetical protein